jgi:ferrochelatase
MAYGSPERLEDVPAYYADVRGGRPVPPERLAELVERYRSLGIERSNPLNEVTERTRAALERELGLPVLTGMKHWHPRIAEAAGRAVGTGADTVLGLVLAPHYSALSIGGYRAQLEEALGDRAQLVFVDSWADEPGLVSFWAERLLAAAPGHVVFTAHSLPAKVHELGDPYEDELRTTARLIADAAGLADDAHSLAYQSASPTGEPWLGPDILERLDELAARGARRVVLCPVGFVADHLEIRWDLDTVAAARARALGLELERLPMPNDDPAFVAVLAEVARRVLAVPSAR